MLKCIKTSSLRLSKFNMVTIPNSITGVLLLKKRHFKIPTSNLRFNLGGSVDNTSPSEVFRLGNPIRTTTTVLANIGREEFETSWGVRQDMGGKTGHGGYDRIMWQ